MSVENINTDDQITPREEVEAIKQIAGEVVTAVEELSQAFDPAVLSGEDLKVVAGEVDIAATTLTGLAQELYRRKDNQDVAELYPDGDLLDQLAGVSETPPSNKPIVGETPKDKEEVYDIFRRFLQTYNNAHPTTTHGTFEPFDLNTVLDHYKNLGYDISGNASRQLSRLIEEWRFDIPEDMSEKNGIKNSRFYIVRLQDKKSPLQYGFTTHVEREEKAEEDETTNQNSEPPEPVSESRQIKTTGVVSGANENNSEILDEENIVDVITKIIETIKTEKGVQNVRSSAVVRRLAITRRGLTENATPISADELNEAKDIIRGLVEEGKIFTYKKGKTKCVTPDKELASDQLAGVKHEKGHSKEKAKEIDAAVVDVAAIIVSKIDETRNGWLKISSIISKLKNDQKLVDVLGDNPQKLIDASVRLLNQTGYFKLEFKSLNKLNPKGRSITRLEPAKLMAVAESMRILREQATTPAQVRKWTTEIIEAQGYTIRSK